MRYSLVLVAMSLISSATARNATEKPNFVMLFVDDLGYGDLGIFGHPTIRTPNIDRLARRGKRLNTWYTGCPVCSGSRAALMTGRQFPRFGFPGMLGAAERIGLPLSETTLAEQLKKGGYATAAIGKWHLGQRRVYMPGNRGFDYYLGIPYSGDMGSGRSVPCNGTCEAPLNAKTWSHSMWHMEDYIAAGYYVREPEAETLSAEGYPPLPLVQMVSGTMEVLEQPLDFTHLAEKYNQFALDFIHNHKDVPFFLYFPFSHVHVTDENQPESQFAGCSIQNTSRRGKFGDAVAEVDWIVGNVHQALVDTGVEENTLILFTSDNGPWLAQGASAGSMGLFTGRFAGYWNTGKGSTWEGGIRMPAFAYWKGQIPPATRSAETVSTMDVFPTLSALAEIPLPVDTVYDGKDMTDILLQPDGKSKHDFLFIYGGCGGNNIAAVRHGKWKAHFCTGPGLGGDQGGGRTGQGAALHSAVAVHSRSR